MDAHTGWVTKKLRVAKGQIEAKATGNTENSGSSNKFMGWKSFQKQKIRFRFWNPALERTKTASNRVRFRWGERFTNSKRNN